MIYLSIILYIILTILVYSILVERRNEWLISDIILDDPSCWILIIVWPFTLVMYPILVFLFGLLDIFLDIIKEFLNKRKNKK